MPIATVGGAAPDVRPPHGDGLLQILENIQTRDLRRQAAEAQVRKMNADVASTEAGTADQLVRTRGLEAEQRQAERGIQAELDTYTGLLSDPEFRARIGEPAALQSEDQIRQGIVPSNLVVRLAAKTRGEALNRQMQQEQGVPVDLSEREKLEIQGKNAISAASIGAAAQRYEADVRERVSQRESFVRLMDNSMTLLATGDANYRRIGESVAKLAEQVRGRDFAVQNDAAELRGHIGRLSQGGVSAPNLRPDDPLVKKLAQDNLQLDQSKLRLDFAQQAEQRSRQGMASAIGVFMDAMNGLYAPDTTGASPPATPSGAPAAPPPAVQAAAGSAAGAGAAPTPLGATVESLRSLSAPDEEGHIGQLRQRVLSGVVDKAKLGSRVLAQSTLDALLEQEGVQPAEAESWIDATGVPSDQAAILKSLLAPIPQRANRGAWENVRRAAGKAKKAVAGTPLGGSILGGFGYESGGTDEEP